MLLILKSLWSNKIIRYSVIIIFTVLALSLYLKHLYNGVYTKGYNEGVAVIQKQLDDKYNKAIERIKEENIEQARVESERLLEVQKNRDNLKKQNDITNKKLADIIKKSKSGLVNEICKTSDAEGEFYNEGRK